MKVIIPAAGLGSRLRPHTYVSPKALLPVAGRPIIGHIIDQVTAWGGDDITIIVGHLGEQIEKWVAQHYPDMKVEFQVQERKLGLGHAVLTGIRPDDRELLVILGDTILETDLDPVVARGVTAIGVKEVADPRKLGVVVVKEGRVERLLEKPAKPPSNLAIVGIYYINDAGMLSRAVKETIERGITVKGEYQITDALQVMLEWGHPVETFPVQGWYDCGRPEHILETNRYLFDRNGGDYGGAEIEESVILPPVFIGEGSRVERSIVGPYVSIGEKTTVANSLLKDVIIGDSAAVEQVVLKDSLIGSRARVSGGFRSLNIGASTDLNI